MKRMTGRRTAGFTLIEILVVVAVVGILASILIPVAGRAAKGSKKRKAQVEVSSLKMAVEQFHKDHHYMPFKNTGGKKGMVGEDKWAKTDDSDWMELAAEELGDERLALEANGDLGESCAWFFQISSPPKRSFIRNSASSSIIASMMRASCGSNCVPLQRSISARTSGCVRTAEYVRVEVIAS